MDKENNNNIIKLYKENNDEINSDDAVDKEIKKKGYPVGKSNKFLHTK